MAQSIDRDKCIVRQNQTGHCMNLLNNKGYLQHLSVYEFAIYVDLMTDFCQQGITDEIRKRLKTFDKLINERISESK